MTLNNRSRNNANPTLFREILILLEICFPLVAKTSKRWVFRQPICKMVFWEHYKLGSLSCSRADEVCCFVEVVFKVQRLAKLVSMLKR